MQDGGLDWLDHSCCLAFTMPLTLPCTPCCPQAEYALDAMDMVKLVNRKSCCQHRIACFQMQLLNQAQQTTYSYNFANGGIQTYYNIRPSENCNVVTT